MGWCLPVFFNDQNFAITIWKPTSDISARLALRAGLGQEGAVRLTEPHEPRGGRARDDQLAKNGEPSPFHLAWIGSGNGGGLPGASEASGAHAGPAASRRLGHVRRPTL